MHVAETCAAFYAARTTVKMRINNGRNANFTPGSRPATKPLTSNQTFPNGAAEKSTQKINLHSPRNGKSLIYFLPVASKTIFYLKDILLKISRMRGSIQRLRRRSNVLDKRTTTRRKIDKTFPDARREWVCFFEWMLPPRHWEKSYWT